MKRTYFFMTFLADGTPVDLIYESKYRKGTIDHALDILFATRDHNIELAKGELHKDTSLYCYILNEKNKYEQCFGENKIVDCR